MTETNIRIVKPGASLYLDARRVIVEGQEISLDLLQRVCGTLQKRYGLAAVPYRTPEGRELLVASLKPIESLVVKGDDWQIETKDSGKGIRLYFSNLEHRNLMAQLVERCLLVEIGLRTSLWALVGDSPRIWYEPSPFQTEQDITVFRRFQMSVIPIDSVSLGVVVDVGTAFFTKLTVADYFLNGASNGDEERLRQRFEFLGRRQQGQKGTLLYDLEESKHKCYFEEFLDGVTCETTEPLRVQGHTYASLLEYYRQKHPKAKIKGDDPVARVSFRGLDRPRLVAANKLRLRVMNEALPEPLKQVDKIPPVERCRLIKSFWDKLGSHPLGCGRPGLEDGFWRPNDEKTVLIRPPALEFACGKRIGSPQEATVTAYKEYYNARRTLLSEVGCFHVPPAVERVIHFAVPTEAPADMTKKIAEGITALISRWTRKDIKPEIVRYSTVEEAITLLQSKTKSGMVVFVFEDEDPATYFNLAYDLKPWRIKRITYGELESRFKRLVQVEAQPRQDGRKPKEISQWRSSVEMSALDVLQQLDCVPWSIATSLNYEAQLIIDVGKDRRHFALSLLICRGNQYRPAFRIDTVVHQKADHKNETINEIILRDAIIEIFKRAAQSHFDPLSFVLALRDGRECGREIEGIKAAQAKLQGLGLLAQDVRLDIVDFHKSSLKEIRMWERNGSQVTNVLEGRALLLDDKTVVLANTGAATLHQGTADPLVLVARGEGVDMLAVATDVSAAAQLNWSSPRVAQRFPLPLKRTDDELKNRAAQEIKRIR